MFVGHYALALAAKRAAPQTSLGTLFAAAQLADMAWPVFLLLGWERVHLVGGTNPFLGLAFDAYPISHSLVTLLAWGLLFGVLYRQRRRYARGGLVVALLVVSHWVLDFLTHILDLPLYPGGPKVGLGLWNSPAGTVSVEALMFVAGIWIYVTTTRAQDGVGRYGLWALLALLALSYVASLFAGPPPTLAALEIGGIVFGWLFVGWAAWADGHRDTALPDTA
jgi:cellulose synthase/poly-beta-1,6-N-acetylglucosamine synthase-like glycosyltransferase